MPDNWEYPWFAAWDLAFHCIPLALVDPDFAKEQLSCCCREWYHAPQRPAAGLRVGLRRRQPAGPRLGGLARLQDRRSEQRGTGDRAFLERVFHKLLLNFTWWVNRKDAEGNNVFQGGFLGLDNIGVFDRSAAAADGRPPRAERRHRWMGMFCLNMLTIALELAAHDPVYEDIATKFFEHFLYIAGALNNIGGDGHRRCGTRRTSSSTTCCTCPTARHVPLQGALAGRADPAARGRDDRAGAAGPAARLQQRLEWFLKQPARPGRAGLALARAGHGRAAPAGAACAATGMKRLLRAHARPESEFLCDYGMRVAQPLPRRPPLRARRRTASATRVDYEPAESRSGLFGGNSNWRGPIWFPINYLLIEALQQVPPLLRRRLHGRVPDRLGPAT